MDMEFRAPNDSYAASPTHSGALPPGEAIHAGFWRRCAAYMLDGLVLAVPIFLCALIPLLGILLIIVLRWLYFALMESSGSQATLGKQAMGIKVTDGAGQRISFGRATGRFAGGFLSRVTLSIGYMMAGWTERKQALHDLMADCCVVFREVEPGKPLPSVRPPMPWYGWVLNILLGGAVPVIGILAAIAIPAYQDYLLRAQVSEAIVMMDGAKLAVTEFYTENKRCPASNAEAGLDDPASMSGAFVGSVSVEAESNGRCVIHATLGGPRISSVLRGKQISFVAGNPQNGWVCGGNIAPKYLPRSCRGN